MTDRIRGAGETGRPDAVAIASGRPAQGTVVAPPSKSHAIRMLLCAALQHGIGTTTVRAARGPLPDDVVRTAGALRSLGWDVTWGRDAVDVTGDGALPLAATAEADVGGSATALRFLAAVCALGPGPYTIGGSPQLLRRPAGAIVQALRSMGVSVKGECGGSDGPRPPLTVSGGPARGGEVLVDAADSSHVVSALLMIGPMLAGGLSVRASGDVASRPYIDLTVRTMRRWGATVEDLGDRWAVAAGGYDWFGAPGGDPGRDDGRIEGDWSSAAFLLGAGAASDGAVAVAGLDVASPQADREIVQILRAMGADADLVPGGARCTGRVSRPIDVDVRGCPDLAPLIGALACLVPGTSRVRGAAHLRIKETDRIAEVVRCARALGCAAEEHADGFSITGAATRGADIDPAGDHRLAMAFAVAGLAVPGTRILDAACVAKSYPAFWDDLRALVGDAP